MLGRELELLADRITISDFLGCNERFELLCVESLRGEGNSYMESGLAAELFHDTNVEAWL